MPKFENVSNIEVLTNKPFKSFFSIVFLAFDIEKQHSLESGRILFKDQFCPEGGKRVDEEMEIKKSMALNEMETEKREKIKLREKGKFLVKKKRLWRKCEEDRMDEEKKKEMRLKM